ncbi:AzlD domain-containing protein [Noviherbaspirillum galbum]|uniref:AzlD domain-containing protein n=1 Tax=Noviherbaspirillum galbum TaxID=2709383 RepID=A0A6B3STG0_9BURK|nr:AzlD domain-containing protein [Noviherbaspirillum galbum]NEX63778.1 AzlD domain-containing protein [Noviherbaspirillum galbum]
MSGTNGTLVILGMAIVTFIIKAAIFILGGRINFPPLLRQALGFIPVTVLTAIIVPMVLAPRGGGMEFHWRNPQLVAATIAILAAAVTRRQLLTIVVGLSVFFAWQAWIAG